MKTLDILLVVLAVLTLLYFNANLLQKRSLSSWFVEKYLWLSAGKKNLREMSEEKSNKMLDKKTIISDRIYKKPNVSTFIEEKFIDGMQVFVLNDKKTKDQKTILYIHGGGYVDQPVLFHFKAVDNISKKLDAKVVFPIYPKTPKYNYAYTFKKMESLYKDILKDTPNPQNITFMGDSAGGGLSLGFAMYARDNNLPQPKDIILLSPWLDVNTNNPEISRQESVDPMLSAWGLNKAGEFWAGNKENMNNPYVSPIFGDFNGLGKISISVGTHEIFLPDNRKLHEILKEKGIDHNYSEMDKMNHTFQIFPIPEARKFQNEIIKIINE